MSVKATFFVCAAILDEKLNIKTINAKNSLEASSIFSQEFGQKPQEILGPFIKKRVSVESKDVGFKCSNQTKNAVYGDWLVSAFILDEPKDQAYLVFLKRLDNKKEKLPIGTIIVPISDLRFI